jgi:hypothetical protein
MDVSGKLLTRDGADSCRGANFVGNLSKRRGVLCTVHIKDLSHF